MKNPSTKGRPPREPGNHWSAERIKERTLLTGGLGNWKLVALLGGFGNHGAWIAARLVDPDEGFERAFRG